MKIVLICIPWKNENNDNNTNNILYNEWIIEWNGYLEPKLTMVVIEIYYCTVIYNDCHMSSTYVIFI